MVQPPGIVSSLWMQDAAIRLFFREEVLAASDYFTPENFTEGAGPGIFLVFIPPS